MLFENMCVNYERPLERFRVCVCCRPVASRMASLPPYGRAQLIEAAQLSTEDVPPLLDEYKVCTPRLAHTR